MLVRAILLGTLGWWIWRWLRRAGLVLGAPTPRSRPRGGDPWAILGIERSASSREIRRAFHQRMSEYHPDKVRDLGPELRDLADRKSREITWAYEQLRQVSGARSAS